MICQDVRGKGFDHVPHNVASSQDVSTRHINASRLPSLTCALYQHHKAFPDYWGECGLEGQPSSGALVKYCLIVQINV